MTSETRHDPTRWDGVSRPITPTTSAGQAAQSVHYNSARHGNHVEDSPELLRLRADSLLDEMMMGGVDVSAADGHRTFSGVDAPVVNRSQPSNPQTRVQQSPGLQPSSSSNPTADPYLYAGQANGADRYANADYSRPTDSGDQYAENGSGENGYRENGHHENGYGDSNYRNGNGQYTDDGYLAESRQAEPPPRERPYSDYNQPMRNERNATPQDPTGYDRSADIYATGAESNRPARPELGNHRYYDDARQQPTRPMPPAEPYVPSSSSTEYGDSTNLEERNLGAQQSSPKPHFTPQPTQPGRYKNDPLETTRKSEPSRSDANYGESARSPMGHGEPSSGDATRAALRENRPPAEPARPQSLQREPTNSQPAPVRPPLPPVEPPRTNIPPRRVAPQPLDEHTQWATQPEKWEYQDFSTNPDEEIEAEEESLFTNYTPPAAEPRRVAQENSAVRNDPAQFVSAMSVMGSNKKRSTLLPRSSELDVDLLNREISELHGEISMLLPVGNETGERARHLLDKAYSILQSDPSRSAEVEYYMQQVRTIVQRLHQARQWSNLYRKRLNIYLWSWVGLSAMVLFGRFFFQIDMEDGLVWLFNLTLDHWLVIHWATFIGSAAAGALGGAIGALYTMRNHARSEYSFFDRKYGLRGLILPLIGLIVGAVGYLIFGLIFALVGINPSQTLVAAVVPMTAAFAFGFSQESIYGTRS